MRAKTNFTERPRAYEIKDGDAGQKIIFFRQNIEEIPTEDGAQYIADEYTMTVQDSQGLDKRVDANFDAWLDKAISEDYDRAAAEVREARNKLLADSDKEMVLDRLGLEIPHGDTFSEYLSFLRTIAEMVSGGMAKYRQELRDLTKQGGFPYNVVFPEKPKK